MVLILEMALLHEKLGRLQNSSKAVIPRYYIPSDLHHKLQGFMMYLIIGTITKLLELAIENGCNFYGRLLVIVAMVR